MKRNNIITKITFTALFGSMVLSSCGDSNSPGVEYMPDMYRSPAIEAYVDYEYPDSQTSRLPVEHTIARGYHPYPFENNLDGYLEAGNKLRIPFRVTDEVLAKGGELFASFCQHCHGPKGEGNGSITHPVYSAIPSYADQAKTRRGGMSMSELKAGNIYHTIMYGLNAMGPHASQLTEEERWLIVSYVETLQGKGIVQINSEAASAPLASTAKDTVINN